MTMTLSTISLTLARNPGTPSGDAGHGYVLRAPLDANGYFDRNAWKTFRALCTVIRTEDGGVAEQGLLVHTKGGWGFSYTPGTDDDETLFRLGDHRFAVGEYLSITEHDGVQRTFRVDAVSAWHPRPVEPAH